jgi:hypothetical protein
MSAQNAMESLSSTIKQMIENDRQKIGGLTFGASARLGLEELRQAVSLDGSISDQTQTPLGVYGTLTPGEISAARQMSSEAEHPSGDTRTANTEADPVQAAQQQAQATSQSEPRDHGASR